jgi:hypothetical protein
MGRHIYGGQPTTENESLRLQLKAAQDELRAREVEEFKKQQAEAEIARQVEDEMARNERSTAEAEALEARRRSAWLQHETDRALERGPDAFQNFLMQRELEKACLQPGWPPGTDPAAYKGELFLFDAPDVTSAIGHKSNPMRQ